MAKRSKNTNDETVSNASDNVSLAFDLAKKACLAPYERFMVAFMVRIGETLDEILAEVKRENTKGT